MKKMAALIAGVLMMAASTAFAIPILTLSDGTKDGTVEVFGTDGFVSYNGAVGKNWSINVSTGLFGTAAGAGVPQMNLNSVDSNMRGTGGGTLKITFSDTISGPWSGNGANIRVNGNSNVSGSVTFETIVGSTTVSTLSESGEGSYGFGLSDTFAYVPSGTDQTIELIATITQQGKGTTSFDYSVTPTPEPGTMVLLGAGFLGLAIYGKRRRNA